MVSTIQRGSTVYRTASWVPMVSSIERFYCIKDSQLGPRGVHYREVSLYVQNAVQWFCSMYSQSDSSSPLPEGVCGPPRRGAGGKISKGQGLGCVCG